MVLFSAQSAKHHYSVCEPPAASSGSSPSPSFSSWVGMSHQTLAPEQHETPGERPHHTRWHGATLRF